MANDKIVEEGSEVQDEQEEQEEREAGRLGRGGSALWCAALVCCSGVLLGRPAAASSCVGGAESSAAKPSARCVHSVVVLPLELTG